MRDDAGRSACMRVSVAIRGGNARSDVVRNSLRSSRAITMAVQWGTGPLPMGDGTIASARPSLPEGDGTTAIFSQYSCLNIFAFFDQYQYLNMTRVPPHWGHHFPRPHSHFHGGGTKGDRDLWGPLVNFRVGDRARSDQFWINF
jgi:hypothetical protein